MNSRPYRLGSLLALLAVPWTVLVGTGGVRLVFLWGPATPAPSHAVGLPEYLFVLTGGLPDRLLAWPASTVLFLAGAFSAIVDGIGRGDERVTAGLLGLSALAHGRSRDPGNGDRDSARPRDRRPRRLVVLLADASGNAPPGAVAI